MSKEDENLKWYEKPIIRSYSILDFARTSVAVLFIVSCMTFLTLYVHKSVEKATNACTEVHTEYINMAQSDIFDDKGNRIIKAPDFVVEKVLDFPVAYDRMNVEGYVMVDTSTGAKYLYLRNSYGIAVSNYWSKEQTKQIWEGLDAAEMTKQRLKEDDQE